MEPTPTKEEAIAKLSKCEDGCKKHLFTEEAEADGKDGKYHAVSWICSKCFNKGSRTEGPDGYVRVRIGSRTSGNRQEWFSKKAVDMDASLEASETAAERILLKTVTIALGVPSA